MHGMILDEIFSEILGEILDVIHHGDTRCNIPWSLMIVESIFGGSPFQRLSAMRIVVI